MINIRNGAASKPSLRSVLILIAIGVVTIAGSLYLALNRPWLSPLEKLDAQRQIEAKRFEAVLQQYFVDELEAQLDEAALTQE